MAELSRSPGLAALSGKAVAGLVQRRDWCSGGFSASGDGFAVHDLRSGRRHLSGKVTHE